MKNLFMLIVSALTLFGASSCGNEEDPGKEMDKKVKKALAASQQNGGGSSTTQTVTVTTTNTATSTSTAQ